MRRAKLGDLGLNSTDRCCLNFTCGGIPDTVTTHVVTGDTEREGAHGGLCHLTLFASGKAFSVSQQHVKIH